MLLSCIFSIIEMCTDSKESSPTTTRWIKREHDLRYFLGNNDYRRYNSRVPSDDGCQHGSRTVVSAATFPGRHGIPVRCITAANQNHCLRASGGDRLSMYDTSQRQYFPSPVALVRRCKIRRPVCAIPHGDGRKGAD